MKAINFESLSVKQITINDVVYDICPRSVKSEEEITNIKNSNSKQYEKYLQIIEVFLGKKAVKEIFPKTTEINIDALEMVLQATMDEYMSDYNDRAKKKRQEQIEEIDEVASSMKPIADIGELTKGMNRERKRAFYKNNGIK